MRRWCHSSLLKYAPRSSNSFIERSRNPQVVLHGSDVVSSSCFPWSPVTVSWPTDPSHLSISPSHLEVCPNCDSRDLKRKRADCCGLPNEASEDLSFSHSYSSSTSSGYPSPWGSSFLGLSSRSVLSRGQECELRVRSRGLSSAAEQSLEKDATATAGGEVSQNVVEIVDEVTGLTLMEIADLTEVLRKKFGVDEMPMMEVMMPGMGIGGVRGGARAGDAKAEEKKAEKTAFDLKLESFDAASKIKIIKEVRTFTDLGLKEAKDLVEKTPTLLKKGVLKEEAEKIIEKMKAVGANVVME